MSKLQIRKAFPWFLLSILVIILDQASKYWITHRLQPEEAIPILPFFNFILRYNQGGAFNFLRETGSWHIIFLSAVSVVVIIVLSAWLLRLRYPSAWTACALSLVMGGAAGNLIDRLRMGNVVDFLDFHLRDWHYATFNLADSAIVIGIIMLLLQSFFKK